jgi:hypothetical protein
MDTDNKIDVFVQSLAEALSKATDVPVFYQDHSELIESTVDAIRHKLPAKTQQQFKDVSSSELSEQISEFLVIYPLSTKEKSDEHFLMALAQFIESLTKVKTYKAFIFIPKIIGFPPGEQFGPIKTITKNEVVFEQSEGFWEHFTYIKSQYADVNEDDGLWLECTFTSVLNYYLSGELKKAIQPFLGMISLLMFGFPMSDESLIGVIIGDKRREYIAPDIISSKYLVKGWARFHPARHQNVAEVKRLFAKPKNTELERKLVLSSKMYWLALQSYSPEITFISLISALESLLLGKDDRDYIGLKISEKVAFLMADEQQARLELYKTMKKYYDIRSSLVHGKSGKAVKVERADVDTIKQIFRAVYEKVMHMAETYTGLTSDDGKGLDDYINELRFK